MWKIREYDDTNRVPDLQLDGLVVNGYHSGSKFNTNC